MSRPEKVSRADRVSVLMKIIIALEPWHRLAGASLNPNAFWQNDSAPAQPWAIWLQRSLHVPNTQPALPALPLLKAPQELAHLHFEILVSLQKCNSTWTGKTRCEGWDKRESVAVHLPWSFGILSEDSASGASTGKEKQENDHKPWRSERQNLKFDIA